MRRPRPKERPGDRNPALYIQSTRHRFRMELVLEFSSNVTFGRSREVARRILDGLAIRSSAADLPEVFELARLACPELRRSIRIEIDDKGDGPA